MKIDTVLETIERDFKGKAKDYDSDLCLYSTPEGRKCYVGLFIPEGHEGQKYRGTSSGLLNEYPELQGNMPSTNRVTLTELQILHDTSAIDTNIDDLSLDEQKMYLMLHSMRLLTGDQQ